MIFQFVITKQPWKWDFYKAYWSNFTRKWRNIPRTIHVSVTVGR